MPKSALGLQVRADRAVAVRVRGGWKGAAVERVWGGPLDPDRSVPGLEALGLPAESVVTGLPADRLFARTVELAFTDRKRLAQAAPLEAEETLPLPLEDLVWDTRILGRTPAGSRCLVVAAPQDAVGERVGLLAGAGLRVEALDAEPLALAGLCRAGGLAPAWVCDLGPDLVQWAAVGPGDEVTFGCLPGRGTDPDLLDQVALALSACPPPFSDPSTPLYVSGPLAPDTDRTEWAEHLDRTVDLLPLPPGVSAAGAPDELPWPGWAVPLGLALREAWRPGRSGVDLLQGPFAPEDRGTPWKGPAIQAGVYAGILLGLWGIGKGLEIAYLRAQYDTLSSAVRERFRATLPEVTNIVSEVDQLSARVDELEARARSLGSLVDREISPLRLLRDISERIPKEIEVEFEELVVEENRVRIKGVTVSFDAIARIEAELAKHPRFAQVAVSKAETMAAKDKVRFNLTLSLGKKG